MWRKGSEGWACLPAAKESSARAPPGGLSGQLQGDPGVCAVVLILPFNFSGVLFSSFHRTVSSFHLPQVSSGLYPNISSDVLLNNTIFI